MSAALKLLPPLRTIASMQFNDCADALYESFQRLHGTMTRQTFYNHCRDYGVDTNQMQAYFEMVGLRVDKIAVNRSPMDRFHWRLP
jgi:hypothetical protein